MGENVRKRKSPWDGEEDAFLQVDANDKTEWTVRHQNWQDTGDPWKTNPSGDPWKNNPSGDPWKNNPSGDPWKNNPSGDPWKKNHSGDSWKNHSGTDLSQENSLPKDRHKIRQQVPATEEVDKKKGLNHSMSPRFGRKERKQREEIGRNMMEKNPRNSKTVRDGDERACSHVETKNVRTGKGQYPNCQDNGASKAGDLRKETSSFDLSQPNNRPQDRHRFHQYGERVTETKEVNRKNDFYRSMSPSFDGRLKKRSSLSPDNQPIGSRRYPARERSRSRSRGRWEDISRSPSRRRERDRHNKVQKRRSRSRSRDRGINVKPRSRSRSPCNYRWNGSQVSSEICRSFATGKCRKGSECRFLHPDNSKHTERHQLDDELVERLGNRLEHKLPDSYDADRDHIGKQNQGMIPCKSFIKGKCRWGASCKFSHSSASYESRGNKDAHLDCILEGESNKNSKFSHDGPTPIPSHVESRPSDSLDGSNMDNAQRDSNLSQIDAHPKRPISSPNGRYANTYESVVNRSTDCEEQNATSIASLPSQHLDESSHVHTQDIVQDISAFNLSKTAIVSEIPSQTYVMPRTSEDNILSGSNVPSEIKSSNSEPHPITLPGERYQVGESRTPYPEPSFITLDNQNLHARNHQEAERTTDTPVTELLGDVSCELDEHKTEIPSEQLNQLQQVGGSGVACSEDPQLKQPENGNANTVNKFDDGQRIKQSENVEAHGMVEGVNSLKDEKAIRLFKNALVEFVKEILKPAWKEGRMSKEEHKTIVKKVVDKVTITMQGDHVPKTQDKISQYLTHSKPKINKLVQAYVERCRRVGI
ncbi:unnamed protein product [Cuscuta campestris]|uniref:C3H1-type domain-containing protein n=1 Tax=Cuscuta campestris TaxID=132261 RepID=A0A484NIU1_9ASTE|nr:unnamed protein product [Cuscuta campestris]